MSAAQESRCIICGERRDGLEVNEDHMLRFYRAVVHGMRYITGKQHLNKRKYKLVVCKACYIKYAKVRSAYMRRQALYIGIGLAFGVVLFVVSHRLSAIAYGAAITAFMYLLAQLSYMPGVVAPARRPNSDAPHQRGSHR